MDEVEEAIADQGVPRGRLRVSAALGHGRLAIVPLIAAFSARYPNIVVDLTLGDEVVDILAGQADVAVRFGHLPDSPLTARRIGTTGQVVVASPEYLQRHGIPQEPEDLLQHNCLRFNFKRAEPNWPFIRDGKAFSLKVSGNIECSSGEALAQFARVGAGIARIGEFSVSEDLQRGDLIALLDAWNPGDQEPIHAVFVGGAAMPARVRLFVDFLVEHHRMSAGA
jgi:DNA-binding transcriptional LysR family regulator